MSVEVTTKNRSRASRNPNKRNKSNEPRHHRKRRRSELNKPSPNTYVYSQFEGNNPRRNKRRRRTDRNRLSFLNDSNVNAPLNVDNDNDISEPTSPSNAGLNVNFDNNNVNKIEITGLERPCSII